MTLITDRDRAAPKARPEPFYLAPHIAGRPTPTRSRRPSACLAGYARDVLTGELPGERLEMLRAENQRLRDENAGLRTELALAYGSGAAAGKQESSMDR
jgi:hypothetical protein